MHSSRPRPSDYAASAVIAAGPIVLTAAAASVIVSSVVGGFPHLSWAFLTQAPEKAGRAGGIGPVIVSTLLLVAVQTVAVCPVALGMGIFLSEFTARRTQVARLVRWSLDIQAGIPSIVFGLFGNALFCETFGLGFSILSGGLTLACMVLPVSVRAVDEGLRAVPLQHRLSAAALGLSRAAIIFKILIPSVAPALLMGIVLGTTRALAETAALLFTSGYVARMPGSLLDSGRALSVHILDVSMNVGGADGMAQASSLVLLLMLTFLSVVVGIAPWLVSRFRIARQRTTWSEFHNRQTA